MGVIFCKELHAFFSSLMAYVIIGGFLILIGLFVWVFPDTNVLDTGYAQLQPLFYLAPYIFMLFLPAVTMGALAEEQKAGTLEMLLTMPLSTRQLIIGKYLASLVIVALTLSLTLVYYSTIYYIGSPPGNIDTAAVIGAYLGLLLLAGVFLAMGLFTSSLTSRQMVAFLLGVGLCFLAYQGLEAWTALQTWKSYALFLSQLSLMHHYEALSRGVIDLHHVVYLLSVMVVFLEATNSVLNRAR